MAAAVFGQGSLCTIKSSPVGYRQVPVSETHIPWPEHSFGHGITDLQIDPQIGNNHKILLVITDTMAGTITQHMASLEPAVDTTVASQPAGAKFHD